jgi:CTP:molybdopterin cytidylyltransferase MocA
MTADGLVIGAVLLAAGGGTRIGRRPKALLELDGEPLIRRQLRALAGAGVDDIVVVLGHHAALIEPVLQALSARWVHNPQPDDGPVSSQRLGLAALAQRNAGPPDAVIVALADQPMVDGPDITALLAAWQGRPAGAAVVYPEVAGQRGNPVIFSDTVRQQILAGGAGFGCRQWQAAHPAAVAPFVTDNQHYRVDIDTEADLARFEAETGRALRWPPARSLR